MRRLASLALIVAMSLAVAAAARADHVKIRFTAADQKTAAAAVLRRQDLGPGWTGGPRKPDLNPSNCPELKPKQSDLVVTGAAESTVSLGSLGTRTFDSRVVLMRTRQMVSLDWQRSVPQPGWLPCLRHDLTAFLGVTKVVSIRKFTFPQITQLTAAFRAIVRVGGPGATLTVRVDYIVIVQGRAEISLTSFARDLGKPSAAATELRLARLLTRRVSA